MRDERAVLRVARNILKSHKRIDILVNNAGVTYFKDFLRTSIKEFDAVIETNLRGLFLATNAVVPSMVKRGEGLVVNMLSFASKTTYTKSAVYSASKAGAEAMMDVLRAEVRGRGVRVLNIHPGAVLTPMWAAAERKKFAGTMMKPKQVAEIVYHATTQPRGLMVEEIIVRPQLGDIEA